MLQTRIIKSGFKTIWAHKLRSLLTMLSVMIGIAALTIIISLGKGTEEKIMSQVRKLFSSNTIMVASGAGRMDGKQRGGSSSANLKISDLEEIAKRVENIYEWDAVQIAPDKKAQYNGRNTIAFISGQTPSAEIVWNMDITEGRFFGKSENESLARVAIIAPNIRKELFGNSNPIGQQIKIDNIQFQVIGTIALRGIDPHGIDKDNEVIIPINTLLRRVVNLDYLMLGKFLTSDESKLNSAALQVAQILRERHNINSQENDDFVVVTPALVKQMINNANRMFSIYLPLIAIISLLIGCIVAGNLMLISVNERVKEIGLRKAVGAKSKDILTQFLIEASSVTILSGVVGIILGLIILTQITKMMDLPFIISWSALTACFIVSAIAGIAAGYFPAKKASDVQPVNSLK